MTGDGESLVGRVLDALPTDEMSEIELEAWWVSGNGWLDGLRPVDVIDSDPDAVIAAAAQLSEPSPL